MLHENEGLVIDSILKEYYVKEHKKVREGARQVMIHLLIVGSIKTNKTEIYIS